MNPLTNKLSEAKPWCRQQEERADKLVVLILESNNIQILYFKKVNQLVLFTISYPWAGHKKSRHAANRMAALLAKMQQYLTGGA
ncbi:hypothetical protein [Hymenobacter siberiensis]|uniref:hypothetical protein n=1 Tax=Hymenobacter siberiensis TaxID=2848396 RepID=UPI001C1DD2DB|nr:hypothetical protein [Hymenobacter siberiensis]